jgi:uncharacterized protein YbdZ (MbtH family)
MADVGEALMIPIIVLVYGVLDYAVWPVFEALAGGWAIGWMALIVVAELGFLARVVSGES